MGTGSSSWPPNQSFRQPIFSRSTGWPCASQVGLVSPHKAANEGRSRLIHGYSWPCAEKRDQRRSRMRHTRWVTTTIDQDHQARTAVTTDLWRTAVVYQIYPRSFADSNGDGVGDLPGITSRVPYLCSLGVDAVWLSPFYPSALADGGYDVDDHRDVDPRLGTLADFDAMITALHTAGIKVIVD